MIRHALPDAKSLVEHSNNPGHVGIAAGIVYRPRLPTRFHQPRFAQPSEMLREQWLRKAERPFERCHRVLARVQLAEDHQPVHVSEGL